MAKQLAREGAKLVLWDVQGDLLNDTATAIKAISQHTPMCFTVDLSKAAEVKTCSRNTLNACGKVDILINNAGVSLCTVKAYNMQMHL